jgi:protein-tyrosine phosphatase
MHEVCDRLFVGDFHDAQSVEKFEHTKFGLVVNCTKDIPFFSTSLSNDRLVRIPINDDGSEKTNQTLLEAFHVVIPLIKKHVEQGDNVLVHCMAGQQRSCAVVAAALMSIEGLTIDKAISKTKQKRVVAFLAGINYIDALLAWSARTRRSTM